MKPKPPATWRAASAMLCPRASARRKAARDAGIDPSSVHRVRQRDPALAAAWTQARERGVVRLRRGGSAGNFDVPALAPDQIVRASRDDRSAAGWGADRVVAEANQGGDMVRDVLCRAGSHAGDALPVELVRASRGKAARAEPVAALFERGAAGFAGGFPALEAELGGFTPGGWTGESPSPDRADAMIWALWVLMLRGARAARVLAVTFRRGWGVGAASGGSFRLAGRA